MKAKSERRRTFIGDQLTECRDKSGLYFMLGYQKVQCEQKFCLSIPITSKLSLYTLNTDVFHCQYLVLFPVSYYSCTLFQTYKCIPRHWLPIPILIFIYLLTILLGLPIKLGYSKNRVGLCI